MTLSPQSIQAVHWWHQWFYSASVAFTAAGMDQGLALKFGDASCTGTGGTEERYPLHEEFLDLQVKIHQWMGGWTIAARKHSSNLK